MNHYYVFILASKQGGSLFVGRTENLIKKVWERKNGGSKQNKINILVYYEEFTDEQEAAFREHEIKKMVRDEKLKLIENKNPHWVDLYEKIVGV